MAAGLTAWGRPLFGACLGLSWLNSLSNALCVEGMPYTRGIDLSQSLPSRVQALKLAAMTLAFFAAAGAFIYGYRQLLSGAAAFLLIAALRRIEIRQWPGQEVVRLGKYFPAAACLGAYLIAFTLTLGRVLAEREAAGWEAACGVIAGAYAISAWMKWKKAGPRWFSSTNMGLLIAERGYDKPRFLAPLRLYLAASPALCVALAACGLGVEALAVLYVFPWARWPFAVLSTLFQVLIALILGYVELEWIIIVIALAAATA